MSYDYYCINCGRKHTGGTIRFDLAELIGLRTEENAKAFSIKSTLVDLDGLNTYAQCASQRETLRHGHRSVLEIRLSEFLELMAENEEKLELIRTINEGTHSGLQQIVGLLCTSKRNGEERETEINDFCAMVNAQFVYSGEDDVGEDERSLSDYEASFLIQPEFFDNGNSSELYSVEYNADIAGVNLNRPGRMGAVRGYCAACGEPIVEHAGRYPHTMVGLIGVQKAGKTSTIVAMLEEMRLNYRKLGIRYPGNPLRDNRSADRDLNLELYQKGWAVMKTNVATAEGSFNATLLVEADEERTDERHKQLLTFVDIAGEHCYDVKQKTFSDNGVQVYPLINTCQIYLLCTGIAPEEGDVTELPPGAILEVCKGIYGNLREPQNMPPLSLVATKADLAQGAVAREERYNPFSEIKGGEEYSFREEQNQFSMLYANAKNDEVRQALDICCGAYDEMVRTTYLSMIPCWAMGRSAEQFKGNVKGVIPYYTDADGNRLPFTRNGIDRLLTWVFQTAGILNIEGTEGYHFSHIPAMGEGYTTDSPVASGQKRKLYRAEEALGRIEGVKRVFLNCTDDEDYIAVQLRDFEEHPPHFRQMKKRARLYEELFGV